MKALRKHQGAVKAPVPDISPMSAEEFDAKFPLVRTARTAVSVVLKWYNERKLYPPAAREMKDSFEAISSSLELLGDLLARMTQQGQQKVVEEALVHTVEVLREVHELLCQLDKIDA